MTCVQCNAHMKKEAVVRHVCPGEEVCAQGVGFKRTSEMRYSCSVCSTSVPLGLVRVHALRHDKRLLVEEWRDFTVLPRKRGLLHQFVLPDQLSAKLAPLPALAVPLKRTKKKSEVYEFLQKRRKMQISFTRTNNIYQRAVFIMGKRALHRWIRFAAKVETSD